MLNLRRLVPCVARRNLLFAARFMGTSSGADSLFNPTPEHRALREMVRGFTESEVENQANQFNRVEQFNRSLFKRAADLGLLGITIDTKYGGSGMDCTASCIVHEEMSSSDPAFTLSYLAHSLLFTHNLSINGNDEQKMRYLPDACSGARIGGMGMSEPWAGTDVLGMRTTAIKKSDGTYVLNGSKMWITNGALDDDTLGDMFLVYAKTGESKSKSGAVRPQISLFLVDKGMPGFTLGTRIKDKLGMRASCTAEIAFDDVIIPEKNLIGAPGGAMVCMMRNLEIERICLAAMSTGIARRCIEVMCNYASSRDAFGSPINTYGQIQRHIGESYAEFQAGRAYLYNVSNNVDLSKAGQRVDSDGVKLYCSTMAKNVADRAIQVLGGNGYIGQYNVCFPDKASHRLLLTSSHYFQQVERLWRDSKLIEIGGGTVESHHKNMSKDLASIGKIL